jgi:L-arabinose isomerase
LEKVTVGLFGVGLDTYWAQFEGLLDRLKGYQNTISQNLSKNGVAVADAGLVDNPDKARAAAAFFAEKRVDAVFLYVSTYALSHTVLPVAQNLKVPIIILNLQPAAAIDYAAFNAMGDRGKMTGEWLAHCQACAAPEIANVFNNAGLVYDMVTGWLGDMEAWREISDWCAAIRVKAALRDTRFGILGQ